AVNVGGRQTADGRGWLSLGRQGTADDGDAQREEDQEALHGSTVRAKSHDRPSCRCSNSHHYRPRVVVVVQRVTASLRMKSVTSAGRNSIEAPIFPIRFVHWV